MEEARYRALFLAMFMLMLTIGGKCSYLRAKLAHLAGHLPPPPRFSSINCMRRAREQCAWLLPIRHPSPAHTILFIMLILGGRNIKNATKLRYCAHWATFV